MTVLAEIAELAALRGPLHLAVGVFDGVHLGHRAVVEAALAGARRSGGTAVVVTFDPHPVKVLRPERAPRLLASLRHKLRLLGDLGVTHVLVLRFDEAFAALGAAEFVERLALAARPLGEICVGADWRFGRNRDGDVALLAALGGRLGFTLAAVPPVVTADGAAVSSTRVREAIKAGDFATAAALLGREYSVLGEVVEGRKLGRDLGFPTANLRVFNEEFPPNGVYAVRARLDGRDLGGVGNLGLRPTIDDHPARRMLEVHLFDFDDTIYGRELEVRFVRNLRPERKFTSLDALRAQIARDAEQARACMG